MDFYEQVKFAATQAGYGSWPLAGGWLDQTHSVVEAVQLFKRFCED